MGLALRLPSIRFLWKQDAKETGLRDVRKSQRLQGWGPREGAGSI